MKKALTVIVLLVFPILNIFPIVPLYYGARSLSLGFSSSAYNFDINSIFLNPALLSELQIPLGGYQFESGNYTYKSFFNDLSEVVRQDLKEFNSLNESSRKDIVDKLKNIFGSKYGMYGFKANIPGFILKRYGFSVSFYNLTIINPVKTSLFESGEAINYEDIENLKFTVMGLNYRKYSLAYGVDFSKYISMGVSLHYLDGKIGISEKSVTDDLFLGNSSETDILSSGWSEPEEKFGKFIVDLSISSNIGNFLKIGVILKNLSNPKIRTSGNEIEIKERLIISASFRPDKSLGIYFDMDLRKQNLLFNDTVMQPVSLGLEKFFFDGKFIVRGGILTDLTEHYLFGKNSNILYGFGMGFNSGGFVIDAGMGLGNDGKLRSIAVSGFYIIR